MNYKQIEENIKSHITEKTGYAYDVMIIQVDDNIRLLVHTEDRDKMIYKENSITLFTELINAASSCQWIRLKGEKNWLLLSNGG